MNRMTDRCKNITLPQTSFAGGNKRKKCCTLESFNVYHPAGSSVKFGRFFEHISQTTSKNDQGKTTNIKENFRFRFRLVSIGLNTGNIIAVIPKQIIHIISFEPITIKSSENSFHELSMTSVSIDVIGEFWRAKKWGLVDIVWIVVTNIADANWPEDFMIID